MDLIQAVSDHDLQNISVLVLAADYEEKYDALRMASAHGNTQAIEAILPHISHYKDLPPSTPLVEAAQNKHADCVKLLLPMCGPMYDTSAALRFAVLKGDVESVHLLMPQSNPYMSDHCLVSAAINGDTACIDIFYPISDTTQVKQKIENMHILHKQSSKFMLGYDYFQKKYKAEHEKIQMLDAVTHSSAMRASKKI